MKTEDMVGKEYQIDTPSGYTIQLYQYARRYSYNGKKCLEYFNNIIDAKTNSGEFGQLLDLDKNFITFGEFDLMQITPVYTFRQYHDLPLMAKDWLGKRQSVLLYDISESDMPVRLFFDPKKSEWCKTVGQHSAVKLPFFCISMLALTNEVLEGTKSTGNLLKQLRKNIVQIVDKLNCERSIEEGSIECEVFGTFNTSELALVWLADQYVDILNIVDYIKHMTIVVKGQKRQQVFLNSFSVIATKTEYKDSTPKVKGTAMIQITVHEVVKNHERLEKMAEEIAEKMKEKSVYYSVGEYDLVIKTRTCDAIPLFDKNAPLCVGESSLENRKFIIKDREILTSNTRLLYEKRDVEQTDHIMQQLWSEDYFVLNQPYLDDFRHELETEELEENVSMGNTSEYLEVRKLLKEKVMPSAGAVDTLDMLFTDYHSAIASAYSAMWVSDLHRQFNATLYAIRQLLSPESSRLKWSWERYKDLTNNFKQQIQHLSQSNRLFFEVPSCHLRATGQFDFLMHTYYGITKKILEVIYLLQGCEKQSELIPLITVNTVPQVRTQMAFEVDAAGKRSINLDIPVSVIFDPHRGLYFLAHELFHYAAPYDRQIRNERMDDLCVWYALRAQFIYVLRKMFMTTVDGTISLTPHMENVIKYVFGDRKVTSSVKIGHAIWEITGEKLLNSVQTRHKKIVQELAQISQSEQNAVCMLGNAEQQKIEQYVSSRASDKIFRDVFMELLPDVFEMFNEIWNDKDYYESLAKDLNIDEEAGKVCLREIRNRIVYCSTNGKYLERYLASTPRTVLNDINLDVRDYVEELWNAVKESCADIAMISMNTMTIVDYLFFCVQNWKDTIFSENDSVQEKLKKDKSTMLRIGLVCGYCVGREFPHWTMNMDIREPFLKEEDAKKFSLKFVWVHLPNRIKNGNESDYSVVPEVIGRLGEESRAWLDFFAICKEYYLANFEMCEELFMDVLCNYDVPTRACEIENRSIDSFTDNLPIEIQENLLKPKDRVNTIISELDSEIHRGYTGLFEKVSMSDKLAKIISAPQKADIIQLDKEYCSLRFKHELQVAQYFQKQFSLKELGLMNDRIHHNMLVGKSTVDDKMECETENSSNDSAKGIWKYYVSSLTELQFYIKHCYEKLKENAEAYFRLDEKYVSTIWFRGETDEKYNHIPTVMRAYDHKKNVFYGSLRAFQQSNFEDFKFVADGSAEMPIGVRFTKSDYIALMQHYGAKTNFLDFTENAFISLYLALQDYSGKNSDPGKQKNVTFSIFHPGIYNKIRKDSIEELSHGKKDDISKIKKISGGATATLLPNLSTRANEKQYEMFLLGDSSLEIDQKYLANEYKDLYMPLAILTSRLNSRIRTQNGNFLAYNLYSPISKDESGKIEKTENNSVFKDIALEEVQERKSQECIFLYQIVIDKSCCPEVFRWLESLGVSLKSVYPELSEKAIKGQS